MLFSDKLRMIRECECKGRAEFSKKTEIPKNTIIRYENSGRSPRVEAVIRILEVFPQYTLWLMTDKTEPLIGQIQPQRNENSEEE